MTGGKSEINKSKKLKFINSTRHVIPAKAGIQKGIALNRHVIPAQAGIQEGITLHLIVPSSPRRRGSRKDQSALELS
jgi:hypothetical protein